MRAVLENMLATLFLVGMNAALLYGTFVLVKGIVDQIVKTYG